MLKVFCKWYLKFVLKRNKCKTLEIVINCDSDYLRHRDFKREELEKSILKKI